MLTRVDTVCAQTHTYLLLALLGVGQTGLQCLQFPGLRLQVCSPG